jgi:hypothetical protein
MDLRSGLHCREAKAGQQADMPPLHVSQVSSIQRTYPELLEGYRAPAHQFMVATVDSPFRLEGLDLYINLRVSYRLQVGGLT